MKTIQKYVDDSVKDTKTVVPALKDAIRRLRLQYDETTHPKLRILDYLIMFSLTTFFLQVAYMVVIGTKEPFNAFLAGCFCSLGQFALATSLRIQLSDSQYESYSHKKSLIEFMIASFLLYLCAFCLIN